MFLYYVLILRINLPQKQTESGNIRVHAVIPALVNEDVHAQCSPQPPFRKFCLISAHTNLLSHLQLLLHFYLEWARIIF